MKMKGSPILTTLFAAAVGFFIGVSFPVDITPKLQCGILPWSSCFSHSTMLGRLWGAPFRNSSSGTVNATRSAPSVEVATGRNPQEGAERRLPPGIVVSESDLHLRRLWGSPKQDSPARKYLLALAVGYGERANVNATVHKFSDNFDIVLFHYDGRTTEWDIEFEWSKKVTHVSARKQTKWWFAKRFLHPSIVAPYDYVFVWDEDLGVDNFDAEPYLDIVRRHGLEISQPGLDETKGPAPTYYITARKNGSEMHKTDAGGEHCLDVHKRPCSGFVEVMAPVFSRDAWRCVWHMIQDPEEQIGVVDAQYLVHHAVPTLQGQGDKEKGGRSEVKAHQYEEMFAFRSRVSHADNEVANRTSIQN
ncbi:hypothetical protein ACQJBY_067432 [Aegilops geniculata]